MAWPFGFHLKAFPVDGFRIQERVAHTENTISLPHFHFSTLHQCASVCFAIMPFTTIYVSYVSWSNITCIPTLTISMFVLCTTCIISCTLFQLCQRNDVDESQSAALHLLVEVTVRKLGQDRPRRSILSPSLPTSTDHEPMTSATFTTTSRHLCEQQPSVWISLVCGRSLYDVHP